MAIGGSESKTRNEGKGAFSLDTSGVKKQFILCLFLCFSAGWISGCDKPVCTGQDLQGEMYGQSWILQSGLAIRGRYGYVITLSNGEPDGNPCSFLEWLGAGLGADGSGDLHLEEQ